MFKISKNSNKFAHIGFNAIIIFSFFNSIFRSLLLTLLRLHVMSCYLISSLFFVLEINLYIISINMELFLSFFWYFQKFFVTKKNYYYFYLSFFFFLGHLSSSHKLTSRFRILKRFSLINKTKKNSNSF